MTTATCPPAAQSPFMPQTPMPQPASPDEDKVAPSGEGRPPQADAAGNGHAAREPFIPRDTPANPFARQTAALRQAMVDSITAEDMQAVAQRLLEMAKNGNLQAIKLLLSYAVGKPQPAPDPDRLDMHEWEIHKASTNMMPEATAILKTPEPELPLKCVRLTRPAVTLQMGQQLAEALNDPEKFGYIPKEEREAAADTEFDRLLSRRVKAEMHGDLPLPTRRGRRPRSSRDGDPPSPSVPSRNGRLSSTRGYAENDE